MKRHLLLLAVIFSLTSSSHAADLFWSADGLTEGGGPGTWDTAGLHFGPTDLGPFVTAWNNANSDNATFESTAGTVTINAITLNGTLTDNSGYTFSGSTLTLGASPSSPAFFVASGKTLTMSSVVAGSGAFLTKNGTGTFVQSANNTYTGGTIINDGIWVISTTSGTFGTAGAGNNLTINNVSGPVTLRRGPQAGATSPACGVIQQGDVILDCNNLNLNVAFVLSAGGAANWMIKGGNRKITTAASTSTGVFVIGSGVSATARIVEDGTPRTLTFDGAGTVSISAENDITGGVIIAGGTVRTTAAIVNPFGNPASSTLTLGGGTYSVNAVRTGGAIANAVNITADSAITTTSTAAAQDLIFSGNISANFGTTLTLTDNATSGTGSFLPRFSGGFTYNGMIAVNNGAFGTTRLNLFNTTGNDQTFNELISGTGSIGRSASSAGTGGDTIMNAANTYSGGTTLTDGGIGLGIDSTGAGAPPTVTSGPVGTGTITVSPSAGRKPTLFASGGNWTVGNAITFANNTAPLIIKGANELTLQGLITGPGAITKQDSGALRMSTTSSTTYSGGTSLLGGEIAFDANSTGPNDAPTGGPIGTGTLSVGSGTKLSALSNQLRTVGNHVIFIGTSLTLTGPPLTPLTLSGNVDLGGNTVTLSVDSSSLTTLSGEISNGGLTKSLGSTLALSGANIYSGDTTVSGGILDILSTASISQNSVYRLNTAQGTLQLSYAGVATVNGLYINGVQMPNGIYGSETAPITGTGYLCVNNSPVMPQLGFTPSGGNLVFNWPGGSSTAPNLAANCGFKLQSQTNSAGVSLPPVWYDYPGGGIVPVIVPMDTANPSVFFRLTPLP